jgi:hypothetical protein
MKDDQAIAVDITRPERDVLIALCRPAGGSDVFNEPASVNEIARELVVTDAVVKQHLLHLCDKFGIADSEPRRRVALAREALRRNAVSLPELEAASRRAAASSDPVNGGRDAFARRDWEAAYALLSAEDSAEPLLAEDLERLAETCWWSNRHDESSAARQRAHQTYLAVDNRQRAAYMALMMTIHHANRMDFVVAQGVARKSRAVARRHARVLRARASSGRQCPVQ